MSIQLRCWYVSCVCLSLCLGIILRIQTLPILTEQYVTDSDSARFLRQAKIIAQEGQLPKMDMMRWFPLGRKNSEQLTLSSYLIVYLYRFLHLIRKQITIEYAAILYPVIFSTLSFLVFYFLIKRLLGTSVALLCLNFAAVLPPLVARTVGGYADRDALCLFLTFGSYYLSVRAYQAENKKQQFVFAGASGIMMSMLGLTWPGSGLMIAVIVGFEWTRLAFSKYEWQDFIRYVCWFTPLLIGLTCFKTVYYNFAHPLALLAIGFPSLFLILALVYLLMVRSNRLSDLFSFQNRLPLGFSLSVSITLLALLAVTFQSSIGTASTHQLSFWESFLDPFGASRLTSTISELQTPSSAEWAVWPGIFLLFFAAGGALLIRQMAANLSIDVWISITLYEILLAGTVFTRILSRLAFGRETSITNLIYAISVITFFIGMGILFILTSWQQSNTKRQPKTLDNNGLFLLIWFLIMLFCARGGRRFEFFFAPIAITLGCYALVVAFQLIFKQAQLRRLILINILVLLCWEFWAVKRDIMTFPLTAFGLSVSSNINWIVTITITGVLLFFASTIIYQSLRKKYVFWNLFQSCIFIVWCAILIMLTSVSFIPRHRGYAQFSYEQILRTRPFLASHLVQGLRWLQANTPQNAVIAAWWDYGSWINLLANRATIIDEEQIPYWIYLTARHVMLGQTEQEALSFLKSHRATHLMLSIRDLETLPDITLLGSSEHPDRYFILTPFVFSEAQFRTASENLTSYRYVVPGLRMMMHEELHFNGKVYPPRSWQVRAILLKPNTLPAAKMDALIEVYLESEASIVWIRPQEIYVNHKLLQQEPVGETDVLPSTILVSATSENPARWSAVFLSDNARRSLMIRLLVLNVHSEAFIPVYPPATEAKQDTPVRIWQINYPESIQINPKYLATTFSDPRLYQAWMKFGRK